jgi:hypothetical protein
MKKLILLPFSLFLIFIFFPLPHLVAQSEKAVFNMPDIDDPQELEHVRSDQSIVQPVKWFVYSDRQDNVAYTTATGDDILTPKIGFLEIYYVIDETADRVQLVRPRDTHPVAGKQTDLFAPLAAAVGWVPKNRLVLVNHCKQKEGSEAPYKAMIINRLLDYTNTDKYKQEVGHFQFYTSPVQNTYEEEQTAAKVYKIYYIFKASDGKLLLAKAATLSDPVHDKVNILGWINEMYTTPWNSRASLQPNYLDSSPLPAKVADSCTVATLWLKGQEGPPNWVEDPVSASAWPGSRDRLPYLGPGCQDNILHVGIIHDIETEEGQNIMEIMIRLREASKQFTNDLNIVFVMDGTSSMKAYYGPAVSAVTNSVNNIRKDPELNKLNIKWGAVVYRDFAPGAVPLEFRELTSDAKQITTYLSNVTVGMDANDPTLCEAMYNGMNFALTNIMQDSKISPGSINIMILIGDAGDNLNGYSSKLENRTITAESLRSSIIDRIAKLNCHILAYQTFSRDPSKSPYPCADGRKSTGDTTYSDFVRQLRSLILEGTNDAFHRSFPNSNQRISLVLNAADKMYYVDYYLKSRVRYMSQCEQMAPAELTHQIEDIVQGASTAADNFSKIIREIIWGHISLDSLKVLYPDIFASRDQNAAINKIDKVNILKQIIDMFKSKYNRAPTDKELEDIVSGKIQPYLEGYTPLLNWWLFDVLVSDQELQKLIADFGKLMVGGVSQFEMRTNMHKALSGLCGTYIGESNINCNDVTILELFKKMVDCPTLQFADRYKAIGELTIGDILDQNLCDYTMLNLLKIEVNRKSEGLKQIEKSGFQKYGTDVFENIHYFWIPVNKFPFCE